jgi:hypothetical protein
LPGVSNVPGIDESFLDVLTSQSSLPFLGTDGEKNNRWLTAKNKDTGVRMMALRQFAHWG